MRSILADIQDSAERRDFARADPTVSLRDAVVQNLQAIFSTPRGASRAFPTLGLTDVTQVYAQYPDAVGPMERELLANIRLFEPRLRPRRIKHIEGEVGDLRLQFEIHASLVDHGREVPISLRATFTSHQHVTFR